MLPYQFHAKHHRRFRVYLAATLSATGHHHRRRHRHHHLQRHHHHHHHQHHHHHHHCPCDWTSLDAGCPPAFMSLAVSALMFWHLGARLCVGLGLFVDA